jgi:alcohol dehydrogenase class IV
MLKPLDRITQGIFYVVRPLLPWREPTLLRTYEELTQILTNKKISKVFIVVDKNLEKIKLHHALLEKLTNHKIQFTTFSEVTPNPTISQVEKALVAYHTFQAQAIIGFGGGSPLDVAKALGARVAKPNQSLLKMGGIMKVGRKTPLMFAIPTTAGTGSETTLAAVIVDENTKRKYAINDHALIPHYALLVPELTVGLPPFITATTGMDALTHAVEAYLNHGGTKFTNDKAINAVRLIFENLVVVFNEPSNLKARANMQQAAYDAGVAFTRNYVGYVHALSHPLSAFYGLPHGYVNALILPIMLEEYGSKIYKKLAYLARESGAITLEASDHVVAQLFISKIKEMNVWFGIGTTIKEIQTEDIPTLAAYANKEARPLYPTPVLYSNKKLEEIYKKIKGDVL